VPHVIANSSGTFAWTWDRLDFGNNAPNQNPGGLGTFVYNPRFPGQLSDVESGLSYNMARDYNPVFGRYIQSDPIGLGGGINTYGYVAGNPLGYTDGLGLAETSGWTKVSKPCGWNPKDNCVVSVKSGGDNALGQLSGAYGLFNADGAGVAGLGPVTDLYGAVLASEAFEVGADASSFPYPTGFQGYNDATDTWFQGVGYLEQNYITTPLGTSFENWYNNYNLPLTPQQLDQRSQDAVTSANTYHVIHTAPQSYLPFRM
jgi:RHS repeat-associated protein